MNDYFYELAKRAAQAAADKGLTNIDCDGFMPNGSMNQTILHLHWL